MDIMGKAPCMTLNDGHKIPVVALGTGGMGTGKGQLFVDVPEAVTWAIEAGYRHIDTAASYKNEDIVGEKIIAAIARGLVTREQLFVTTKLPRTRNSRHQVIPALKDSLARLKMDYVDLYLIHEPASCKEDGTLINNDYVETWKGMEEAKELGLARSIGVSNFNQWRLERLIANCKIRPAVNQIEVHPAMTAEKLVTYCHKQGIAIMAYCPFGYLEERKHTDIHPYSVHPAMTAEALVTYCHKQGIATMAYCPFGYLAERKRTDSRPPYADDPVLMRIAEKYGKSTAQVVLRYSIDRGLIPVPKSTNKLRIAQNIDIFDFKLADDDVANISRFNQDFSVMDQVFWKRLNDCPL